MTEALSQKAKTMIARYWRGWTTRENARLYEKMLRETILPGIARQNIAGYRGAYLFRRDAGNEVEFATLLFFDSLDAVRAFAGKDYETAVIHKEAEPLLTRYDARSAHYETLLQPPARA